MRNSKIRWGNQISLHYSVLEFGERMDPNRNGRVYSSACLKDTSKLGTLKPTWKQRMKLKIRKLKCFLFGHKLVSTDHWIYSIGNTDKIYISRGLGRCTKCGYLEDPYELGGKK
jgi:hypothetical protein